ncbi:MAG: hypothetical protein IPI46_08885 [Bacteroidetes bacterium]|nr:hypothetical protein [Bacteroidota bacterium]
MNTPIDLSKIYELRTSFTIIGLTGRTGSGCSEIGSLLKNGFDEKIYSIPIGNALHNTDRKYKIVYNFAKLNFKPYYLIEYKHVIMLFIFSQEYEYVKEYLKINFPDLTDDKFSKLEDCFNELYPRLKDFNFGDPDLIQDGQIDDLYDIFNSHSFSKCSELFQDNFESISPIIRIKIMQLFANNIRNGGCAICNSSGDLVTVYNLVSVINRLIKGHKKKHQDYCKVVIDSLRNPLEIMYLKERYSAFYMMAVNSEESDIKNRLNDRYKEENLIDKILEIDKEEYKTEKDTEFFKQNVSECIQKSDIHLSNISEEKAAEFNESNIASSIITSPKFSCKSQLLKFVSLIEQPGIVTPSPEERIMQIAFTAKYNSGCISRQVGAVITDENYSIKAVGWNNTPEGHVPCLLRSADDLLTGNDSDAFSAYEKEDKTFKPVFEAEFRSIDKSNLKGRNISFCFKCIQNSIKEGKNQVHTRSLHAEESAFLQISKYGGQGIKGGKLFTTASPCELCAKKAYQLGISVIYYIDLYPGISISHILKAGTKHKEIRLFHGAIGAAYHKLYSPFMAYKDELSLLTGSEIKDYATKIKDELNEYKKQFGELKT